MRSCSFRRARLVLEQIWNATFFIKNILILVFIQYKLVFLVISREKRWSISAHLYFSSVHVRNGESVLGYALALCSNLNSNTNPTWPRNKKVSFISQGTSLSSLPIHRYRLSL